MEDFIFRGFLSSSLLLSLYVVFRVAHTFWLKPKSQEKRLRKQGIRGTSYKLLNGDMKEFARSSKEARSRPISPNQEIAPRVLPFFYKMVQIYGKVSLCWMGTRPRLLLADPELVRLVLADTSGHITKPPRNALVDLLQLGVSTLEGDKWTKRRRLMTPAFHVERLRGMIPAFSACCCDLVQRWKKLAGPQGSCELDVAREINILASDVIARAAFGSSYEEGKKIFDLQKDQVILVHEAFYSIYFPGLRFIPTKKNKKRYSIDKEIKAALRNIIHKKEQAMQNGDSGDADLLSLLLQSSDDADNDMKIEDVIEECKLFFFAGQETTANLLTWTLIVLSMHPDWQEKAREEVLQICGKRTPDIDSIKQVRIVSMILNEVLRLYPPVNLLYRHTLKETSIRGMSIPAGVDLLLPFLFLHYDPEYWGDNAEEFKPERFSEGVSKASKDEIAFYPFGWGPRFCLGQNFALTEAKMALAMILQNFWFELSPSYTHAPCNVITLQPQHGAPIILHQL
ncbi:PREDICTED: cytochrome P450 CYP72A219-like [Populus euphratica]|uniref:Cytochrome P450 CYP72A219-like n=1 Tax=Populus euphratica TaxID=75702 RepID=A0AAJ6UGE0_POPEU|nr:PREDICTED: cytochrome P450 CYP72A219-like [Populus euphratica]